MASGHGPQFFPNTSNAIIANPVITYVNGNAYFQNTSERHDLDLLRSKVSVAALHNSDERYDAPRCHPGTRVGIQDEIMKWLDDIDDPHLVFWMYGSAGVGKSAIAQAIASLCYDAEPRRLAGAFFLSRSAPVESGRGDEKRLVSTLAYQMAINIPDLERHIATAIARNGLIFDLDLEVQIKELILNPLATLCDEMSDRIPPMILILDALDESSPTPSQAKIVKALVAAVRKMQHRIPHKLLVASRPESHIKSVFATSDISPIVRLVSLDDKYKAQEDIRRFLVDGFLHFKETHPSPAIFPLIWPTDDDIELLVRRSSGHFIYASTAQKYIQEDHANPILRLQSILGLAKDPINRPFSELDALYSHIFRQVKELETVLCLMFIETCRSPRYATFPLDKNSLSFPENLLGLPKGGSTFALQGLSSVIKVADTKLEVYHASLNDFLHDKHRSGDFYGYSNRICVRLYCLVLEYIPPLLGGEDLDSAKVQLSFCLIIITRCIQHINLNGPHSEVHSVLSNFALDTVFQFFRTMKYIADDDDYWVGLFSSFLQWLFREHSMLAQSNNMILLSPFLHLQKWTLKQLKRFQFDKPISSHRIILEKYSFVRMRKCISYCMGLPLVLGL
ncbi:hypothetical protein BJ912DRAFT_424557 [Pholiota molesta]|nr:hypothetical protein BJ912DRAFT_424557 [Pholiota molesta]